MPPHRPPVPSSAIARFIDPRRIDELIAPWVPDAGDRAFLVRCLVGEGPAHHRGANYVLLSLLKLALERSGASLSPAPSGGAPVPMRLPPHLARDDGDQEWPLRLDLRPLERLAPPGSQDLSAMVDCLVDGPPQHALANVAMVGLLGALLARLEGTG